MTQNPPAATAVFVAHYVRTEDDRIVASSARRLHAPHADAAYAIAKSSPPYGMAIYSVRESNDRDTQAWL